jgi:hypothetical protein
VIVGVPPRILTKYVHVSHPCESRVFYARRDFRLRYLLGARFSTGTLGAPLEGVLQTRCRESHMKRWESAARLRHHQHQGIQAFLLPSPPSKISPTHCDFFLLPDGADEERISSYSCSRLAAEAACLHGCHAFCLGQAVSRRHWMSGIHGLRTTHKSFCIVRTCAGSPHLVMGERGGAFPLEGSGVSLDSVSNPWETNMCALYKPVITKELTPF